MKYAQKMSGTHPGHKASETLAQHKKLMRKAHNALAAGDHKAAKKHLFDVIKSLPRAESEPVFETPAEEAMDSPAHERAETKAQEKAEHKPGVSPALLAYLRKAKASQASA